MRYYGALRLDHVMSLFRLWWVAAGHSPTEGAYVHYPLQQLLTVLALESARSRLHGRRGGSGCRAGRDAPRHAAEFGLYHYKVLLFEKLDGRFRRPDEFVRRALATVTTHDMPTLRSFWEGRDIELRRRLKLYPSVRNRTTKSGEQRERDREALLAALRSRGSQPRDPAAPRSCSPAARACDAPVPGALSTTSLVALQIEDLLGMVDPVNVPGTHHEYPNWQRKLTADIEEMADRADFGSVCRDRPGPRSAPD